MDCRYIIWILIIWANLRTRQMEINDSDVSEEISYEFGRNSTYHERQWNITLGSKFIDDNHIEDCLRTTLTPRHITWYPRGPLCEICSEAIKKRFPPEEIIKLRYASFLYGILTFEESQDEMLIDVILCSYDPSVGIDRFYLTRGKEKNSAYFLKTVGSKHNKYKFQLNDYYITWNDSKTN